MRFRETQSLRGARLEGWGGHRSRVYPRSTSNVRKSGKPDLRCSRRRARGCGIRIGPESRLVTMRPGENHKCIELNGIRTSCICKGSHRQPPKSDR